MPSIPCKLRKLNRLDERNSGRINEIGPGCYDPHEVKHIKGPVQRS